jgi:uridine kinase
MDEILQHLRDFSSAPKVLCIDGPAGAGKTELSALIAAEFPGSLTVHMDDLYDGWDDSLGEALTQRLHVSIIEPLKAAMPLKLQKYNWHEECFGEMYEVELPELLIVEGVGAAQEIMRAIATLTVFVDIDDETGKQRVLSRDGGYMVSRIEDWQKQQAAHHKKHRTRESCDLVLGATWWEN